MKIDEHSSNYGRQAMASTIPTIQMLDVHSVQSTNPKGAQHPEVKRRVKIKKEVGIIIRMLINLILMLVGLRKRRRR
jgi:hypothetical protein